MKNNSKLSVVVAFFSACLWISMRVSVQSAEISILNPQIDGMDFYKENQNLNIQWQVSDTVNSRFSYRLDLKDALCKQSIVTISQNSERTTLPQQYNTKLNFEDLEKGIYCLNLCIFDIPEIECNNRLFSIVDTNTILISDEGEDQTSNKPPRINSFPIKLNLNYKENFFYQIKAEDPNGDAFTYRLMSAPDFIYLDQKTGTIANTVIMRPGSYFIAFVVIDRNGAYTQQNFTINVFEKHDSNGNPIQPTPTSPASEKFDVLNPRKGSLLAGTNNLVEWQVLNIPYDKVDIFYFKNGGDKTKLVSITDKTTNKYEWDVTGLTNGQYNLIIEIVRNNVVVTNKTIESIMVGNDVNSSALLILNLKPLNQSEVVEAKPEISANIIPSGSGQIKLDQIEVTLDGKKISQQCSLNNNEIKCFPEKELPLKEHTVRVKVRDTNDQEAQQQWSFTVVEAKLDPTPMPTPDENGQIPTPSPTPEKGGGIGDFFGDLVNRISDLGSSIWMFCCGILGIGGVGFLGFRFVRGRSGNAYSRNQDNLGDVSETTRQELASVTPGGQDGESELEDFTDYSVGNYSVGEEYEAITPGDSLGVKSDEEDIKKTIQPTENLETPSFGTQDTDILPDWLKGDSSESSMPVSSDGEIVSDGIPANEINDGAVVHDDFGLTDDNNVEEDKDKSQ